MKGTKKGDKSAREEAIKKEIQRRVFEASQERSEKREKAEDEKIELDALAEVSELPAQEIKRISREVRAEHDASQGDQKRRGFPSVLVFVLAFVALSGMIAFIVGTRLVEKTSREKEAKSRELFYALLKAVEEGNTAMTEYLLDQGAPLQGPSTSGMHYYDSALMTAAATERVGLVKMLMARGADVAFRSAATGWTALDYADDRRNQALVDILGQAMADASAEGSPIRKLWALGIPFSRIAFVERTKRNDLQAVRLFLSAGMDVNAEGRAETDDDVTPLTHAALAGLVDMARLIVTEAPPENRPLMADPLHYAVREAHIDIVRILLQAGADPNSVLIYDALPHPQIALLLLEYGIDINAGVGNDKLPALVAVLDRWYTAVDDPTRKRWVRFLLDHGADPKIRGGGLKTALNLAQAWGDPEVVGWIEKAENAK